MLLLLIRLLAARIRIGSSDLSGHWIRDGCGGELQNRGWFTPMKEAPGGGELYAYLDSSCFCGMSCS